MSTTDRSQIVRLQLVLKQREHELSQQRELVRQLQQTIARLEQRVCDLEMRVRRDSSTSSAPPSSDKPWDKQARRKERNKRKKDKRKKGGAKKGHKGSRRSIVEPDEIQRHLPEKCESCGEHLAVEPARPAGRRQVTELVHLTPRVTEHRLYSKRCKLCGHRSYGTYPVDVQRTGGFGPRLRALMALLRGAYGLSLRKSRQFLREVIGVTVSHGALSANEERLSKLLEGSHQMVDRWLSRQQSLFVDETSWYQRYMLCWLWAKSDGKSRCYKILQRRNTDAAKEILGDFSGLLTTDQLGSYNFYQQRKRQLCLGHLQRNVRGFVLHPATKSWAHAVDKAFDAMFHAWHLIRDGTYQYDERRIVMDAPEKKLRQLFEQGKSHENKRVRRVCTRVLKTWKMWWRFVVVGSEPTNNEAERSLRPAVIFRKLSHGSRSERGSRFFERIMTVVETLRGHGQNVFDFLCRTLSRDAHGQTLPLLHLGD